MMSIIETMYQWASREWGNLDHDQREYLEVTLEEQFPQADTWQVDQAASEVREALWDAATDSAASAQYERDFYAA